jgi:hypothetical protein
LIFFNVIILLLFITVVFIGKQSWGKTTVTVSEQQEKQTVTKDVPFVKGNPLLTSPTFVKRNKADIAALLTEEPEIIELDQEELEEDEPFADEFEEPDYTEEEIEHSVYQANTQVYYDTADTVKRDEPSREPPSKKEDKKPSVKNPESGKEKKEPVKEEDTTNDKVVQKPEEKDETDNKPLEESDVDKEEGKTSPDAGEEPVADEDDEEESN